MEENLIGKIEDEISDKNAELNTENVIKIRKDKLKKFFTGNYNFILYLLLAVVVFIAVKIRIRNLAGLRDITTGAWTLGPDLDPFLFLRWAEYIVEHGKLFAVDTFRYIPLGFNTTGEYLLLPYSIAWFHKIAVLFGSESVAQSAVIYPVVMFALTLVGFFFMAREMLIEVLGKKKAGVAALIAPFFFAVIPVILPRTIAGIPEKESIGFLFILHKNIVPNFDEPF